MFLKLNCYSVPSGFVFGVRAGWVVTEVEGHGRFFLPEETEAEEAGILVLLFLDSKHTHRHTNNVNTDITHSCILCRVIDSQMGHSAVTDRMKKKLLCQPCS